MRIVDADELMEHVWRDKLDSRELIAQMINNAPTIKEIPTKIPIDIFEQLISQKLKTGHWIDISGFGYENYKCSECGDHFLKTTEDWWSEARPNYCPNCGAKMS